jgi:hypothetical protein
VVGTRISSSVSAASSDLLALELLRSAEVSVAAAGHRLANRVELALDVWAARMGELAAGGP